MVARVAASGSSRFGAEPPIAQAREFARGLLPVRNAVSSSRIPCQIPGVPSLLYDTAAEEYFKHHDLQSKRINVTIWLTDLEKRTPGRRLLDVGCGQGVFLDVASSRGWEVIGLDVSDQFAKYAHDKQKVQARVGDIATMIESRAMHLQTPNGS